MKKDFVSIRDYRSGDLFTLLELSKKIKEYPANFRRSLEGKSVAMILEKPSLRTHVTFDLGIHQLGGHCVYLGKDDINLGKRESVVDIAKNLERWVDGVVIRTYAHRTCVEMAQHIKVPTINALTDLEHPCQAIGDFFTVAEHFGGFKGRRMVFVGDGNNVCHSLMLMASRVGMDFCAVTPRGYLPKEEIFTDACKEGKLSGAHIDILHNPREAVRHADVVYTDVWVSMGEEDQQEERREAFREYQVDTRLMQRAKPSAILMHCLPAHRGEEVSDEVLNSSQSVVFSQAENRLHTEKAILHFLIRGD